MSILRVTERKMRAPHYVLHRTIEVRPDYLNNSLPSKIIFKLLTEDSV